eukprot:TRINITY_DN8990_c0_g1_i1.p1 TRINITY_DN8990_c0_g1~~TRINITY_DN8990_c0_g1_i1.p1  ORF type:complete len:274 (+),score=65.68 TRINITY_DN8990_c0_g1_i1:195-1016(+)
MSDSEAQLGVAVVTGANKGIGYHIAALLAESGQYRTVVIACRNPALASEAAAALSGTTEVVAMSLDLDQDTSITDFVAELKTRYGAVQCFVNNAAIAFKGSDPTPFAGQTGPTLHTNLFQTLNLTEAVLPLLLASPHGRLVNVASMAGRLRQVSAELQQRLTSEELTLDGVRGLAGEFAQAVAEGSHKEQGWSSSNYGVSKLCLIAATKVLAREHSTLRVNCCCPGFCRTDMSSNHGNRHPADGARNAVMLCYALEDDGPTGQFVENFEFSNW